ncbi:MAG: branched-chain amino acid ABC transporter permease [Clostridiales bacterium]|nr:branched-chain amino acid ABC transporter permease [Bacillota bacterium]NLK03010.1 branched-chain amino acid ABC transporter permease [Clostridiales bacterium]
MNFISYLFNGISLGSVYSIIALGYTMVYGIAKMLNFAHGDVIMVGGFVIFTFMSTLGLSPVFAILIGIILCTLLGITIERIAYKPLRRAPSLAVLITAIGVSYFLQNLALLIFGAESRSFSSVIPVKAQTFAGGKVSISGEALVTIPLCIIIMVSLTIFIRKSKVGRGMIAVAEDKDAAVLMGVNVNKTIAITFAIGSALAAIASALMFSTYTNLSTTSGAMPGIKAFVAAVFGGIGSIPGAMIGGIVLGIIEILSRAYISSQLSDAIVFLVLIIVLLVKPTGIMGKKIQEKV